MDISSLLSPAESPANETPPSSKGASPSARASPARHPGRPPVQQRKSSGLSQQQYPRSPRSQEHSLPSLAAHNAAVAYHNQQAMHAPSSSNAKASYAMNPTPPQSNPDPRHTPPNAALQRHGSTPQMDTLAGLSIASDGLQARYDTDSHLDLASMQQHQHSSPQASVPPRDPKPAR